jgi:hypothetical protein
VDLDRGGGDPSMGVRGVGRRMGTVTR